MKLKPCPNALCGSDDIENTGHYVVCHKCGCRSKEFYPVPDTDYAAISWNTRPKDKLEVFKEKLRKVIKEITQYKSFSWSAFSTEHDIKIYKMYEKVIYLLKELLKED